jgi:hypothetical protein
LFYFWFVTALFGSTPVAFFAQACMPVFIACVLHKVVFWLDSTANITSLGVCIFDSIEFFDGNNGGMICHVIRSFSAVTRPGLFTQRPAFLLNCTRVIVAQMP